jgi:hypothetical protein
MTLRTAAAGQIEEIKAHLSAGNQIAIVTYGRVIKLTPKHVDYIRADGEGYRLGWPGKKSVFAFAHSVRFVPAGFRI